MQIDQHTDSNSFDRLSQEQYATKGITFQQVIAEMNNSLLKVSIFYSSSVMQVECATTFCVVNLQPNEARVEAVLNRYVSLTEDERHNQNDEKHTFMYDDDEADAYQVRLCLIFEHPQSISLLISMHWPKHRSIKVSTNNGDGHLSHDQNAPGTVSESCMSASAPLTQLFTDFHTIARYMPSKISKRSSLCSSVLCCGLLHVAQSLRPLKPSLPIVRCFWRVYSVDWCCQLQ